MTQVGANPQTFPRSDCSLQLESMKLESLVIADQHAAVNMYPSLVHTARHTLGIDMTSSLFLSMKQLKIIVFFV